MSLTAYPDVLTIQDLMAILHIGKNAAYRLVQEGIIKAHKIGRIYRIPKICLNDYLQSARYTSNI